MPLDLSRRRTERRPASGGKPADLPAEEYGIWNTDMEYGIEAGIAE
jgi:hypothetical protein